MTYLGRWGSRVSEGLAPAGGLLRHAQARDAYRRAIAAARGNPGWVLAILGVAAHLWASRGYDYFRDEMYFIVCGERLDWGFVDQPPLIPAVAATMHHLFPGSLVML